MRAGYVQYEVIEIKLEDKTATYESIVGMMMIS